MDASNNVIPINNTPLKADILTQASILTQALNINNYNKMDDVNKKAALIMLTSGPEAAITHMFTGENGERLTYLEMRERYG